MPSMSNVSRSCQLAVFQTDVTEGTGSFSAVQTRRRTRAFFWNE